MEKSDSVLIVDDDPEIRRLLVDYLERNHFDAIAARDGREMWQQLDRHAIDLIVLDLMLPDADGLMLCRDLRAKKESHLAGIPVLMLTARGEDADRIVGIEMGADDYLVKPFNPRELLARIKSILRRTRALPPNLRPESSRFLCFAGWSLDTGTRLLTAPDGVVTPLSGGEYRLLRILLDHPNRVLNRDQLTEMIHGREAEPYDRAIDVQISRLRQRLHDDSREPGLIETVRGEGYVLISHLLVTLLIVVAVVMLAVREATKPLQKLAQAADTLGIDLDAPPLAETGPTETRRAAQAFNHMQERIRRLLGERSRALAAVSHDLRTPLTRLRLRTELVEDPKLRSQMEADLEAMAAMLDATLDYLRDIGDKEPPCLIDINALVLSLIDDASILGQEIQLEGAARAPYSGHLTGLRRALQNLIDNAFKYGRSARIRIEDSSYVLSLAVEDEGPGIPEAELARVNQYADDGR